MSARARLFVALELPEEIRRALAGWGAAVGAGRPGMRPLATDSLHLTLCFLGWRDEAEIDAIAAACGVVAGRPAVQLAVGGAVWLPVRRPRVLAVRLDDRAGLAELQRALAAELQAGSWYQAPARAYLAHITVVRVSRERGMVAELGAAPPELNLLGSTVTLYRSRLEPTGARYEPLRSVQLR